MFIATHIHNLESQFLEEIAAALCLLFTSDILLVEVTLKENLLQILLHINLSFGIYKVSFINSLLQVDIYDISRGENVTDVDILDKGLQGLGFLFGLRLAH